MLTMGNTAYVIGGYTSATYGANDIIKTECDDNGVCSAWETVGKDYSITWMKTLRKL